VSQVPLAATVAGFSVIDVLAGFIFSALASNASHGIIAAAASD